MNKSLDSMTKMMESLLERVKNIETKIGENGGVEMAKTVKSSIEKLEDRLEEKLGNGLASYAAAAAQGPAQSGAPGQDTKSVKDIVKEAIAQQAEDEKEIERRSKNMIIYRIPEARVEDRAAAEIEDRTFLKDLLERPLELTHNNDAIKQVIRLGKKTNGSNARPMLVKLSTEEYKNEIMSNLKKLKNAEDKFKKISVAHDLIPKQREAVKLALASARREQETQDGVTGGSQSGNWLLRVVDQQKIPRVVKIKVS